MIYWDYPGYYLRRMTRMSLRMIVQDIQIGYYGMMSRIVQSQRKNSPRIMSVKHHSFGESVMPDKNEMQVINTSIVKSK